jgi:hypothetical protein
MEKRKKYIHGKIKKIMNKLVTENLDKLYRCGWCGGPTTPEGVPLKGKEFDDAIEKIVSGGKEEVLIDGDCYKDDKEQEREMERAEMEKNDIEESGVSGMHM